MSSNTTLTPAMAKPIIIRIIDGRLAGSREFAADGAISEAAVQEALLPGAMASASLRALGGSGAGKKPGQSAAPDRQAWQLPLAP